MVLNDHAGVGSRDLGSLCHIHESVMLKWVGESCFQESQDSTRILVVWRENFFFSFPELPTCLALSYMQWR